MTYRFIIYREGKSGLHKDTVPGNTWRGQTLGIVPQKINRLIEARVKRCGKSTPALLVTMSARKTPLEARPSRDDIVNSKKRSLASHQGWLLEL